MGFACILSEANRTNWPTVEAKPEMKLLKGKLVMNIAYKNWIAPESISDTRNTSISLSLGAVLSLYDFSNTWTGLLLALQADESVPYKFNIR